MAPGSFEETLHFQGKGTSVEPIVISFAPGRYDLFPDKMLRRRFDISNANSDAETKKVLALFFEGAEHVKLIGAGATLVCRGKMIELCMKECVSIEVEGISIDYQRPTVSEWTVISTGRDWAEIQVHPDSCYRIEEGKITWVGEGWSESTGLAQELIPETFKVWRRKDPLQGLQLEEIEPNHLRAVGVHDMVTGRAFQLRNPFRDGVGVFIQNSRDVVLRKVHLIFMHGMGVLCQFSENITLEDVKIAPKEESGRTTSAWADCTHFSSCRGKVVLRNCTFNGAHDDAVNVHGTHLRVIGREGERRARVAFMHPQTFGFQAFYPGDEIEYVHADSLAAYGKALVEAVEVVSPYEQLLTLDRSVPEDLRENDVVENVTWTPEVELRDCKVMGIPTRGFLLTTRRRVVVERNTFVSLGNGIHIESDGEGWFESGCVRDMLICNNRFLSGKGPAIKISPHNSVTNNSIHRNIEIRKNEFDLSEGFSALEAHGVRGLMMKDNSIDLPAFMPVDEVAVIRECEQVVIENHDFGKLDRSSSEVIPWRGWR
jgi:hypothetical protein